MGLFQRDVTRGCRRPCRRSWIEIAPLLKGRFTVPGETTGKEVAETL